MGLSGETFLEMRAEAHHKNVEHDLLPLMTEDEYEESLRQKYGSGIVYKRMLEDGERVTINDLDNLFNI